MGEYSNGGREWRAKGDPEKVLVDDFMDKDLRAKQGWVSVGIDQDMARLAAEAIRRWWTKMESKHYPEAEALLVIADGGASNASAIDCGRSPCGIWPIIWAWRSTSATSRPGAASEIRSSIESCAT